MTYLLRLSPCMSLRMPRMYYIYVGHTSRDTWVSLRVSRLSLCISLRMSTYTSYIRNIRSDIHSEIRRCRHVFRVCRYVSLYVCPKYMSYIRDIRSDIHSEIRRCRHVFRVCRYVSLYVCPRICHTYATYVTRISRVSLRISLRMSRMYYIYVGHT